MPRDDVPAPEGANVMLIEGHSYVHADVVRYWRERALLAESPDASV